MTQISHIAPVVKKIKKLIPNAPSNWAEIIAGEMNCTVTAVYNYTSGIRGARNGKSKEVLKHLLVLVEKEKKEIKKLTA